MHSLVFEIPKIDNITLELDDSGTSGLILLRLPFTVKINIWGEEIYTEPIPVRAEEENAKPVVELFDVAYWPPGQALCLFFGPTPISKDEIRPYSPVNVIGKIKNPDKKILSKLRDGMKVTIRLAGLG
ncbi:MAG TPA: cyclophilin-like fold protein [Candidatus Nitrosotenuis sp.]